MFIQCQANLESPSQPESPGGAEGVLGCGCKAGWVPGGGVFLVPRPPAPRGRRVSARLRGEEGMCAAGGWLTLPDSQLCF